jgi:riboflavin kinase/FMN adenylyltransferase
VNIYHNINDYKPSGPTVVTVGTFDGVHLGHRDIFKRMVRISEERGMESIVVTFDPHPRLVIHPDSKDLKFINTQERKNKLIEQSGIDALIIIPFTREFANTPSSDFVKNYLVDKLKVGKLIVGYDHHFGKDRQGSFNELMGLGKIYGFLVEEISAREVNGIPISSTKIRNALISGDVKLANSLLGYDYSISGKVIRGNKIGRTIGFPTANIDIEDRYKLFSAIGVYACLVDWNHRTYKGMGNIGFRPTVDRGKLTIEVHIFDFDEEIYGEKITIRFLNRIRDEIEFENLSELRKQLISDKARVVDLLKEVH